MRTFFFTILALLVFFGTASTQSLPINSQQFFLDERVIEVTLTTDLKKLKTEKKVPTMQPATIQMRFSDSVEVTEQISVQPRGEYRKNNCDIASLMLQFKNTTKSKLSKLKKLKLVGGCNSDAASEELLLKEYLLYKIYNHLTNMSFRVRLMHVNYKDSRQKTKGYSQYAFLIEGTSDMAKRNNCVEIENTYIVTEQTNRQHTTMVAIFQYMIGNTDWAVPRYHNIKLMAPKNDTLANPYVIPYDFDYCGTVDAPYAVPPEQFNTTSVKERVYRGFGRTADEINQALTIFNEKKEQIFYTINNFSLLRERVRKDMSDYIQEFYKMITNKKQVKSIFIDGARKD